VSEKNNFYITSQPELDRLVALINERKLVALDTEFTRQTTYYPILSIVQVAVKNSAGIKESFIIDCLIDLDLNGFLAIIADEKIIKILHSPAQDLQIFNRQSKLIPRGIVDTQILASFCGLGFNIGYSGLVEILFKRQLNKNQQRSDWQRRPLSSGQIKYAFLDVFFLEEIYEKLSAILSKKNRRDWYAEEMEIFTQKLLTHSEENLLKKFSLRHKSQKQIFQIENLISWREQWAQKLDVPRQHLLRDERIEMLVAEEFAVKDLGKKFTKEMIDEVAKILTNQEELPKRKENIPVSDQQKITINKAKALIAKISTQENFREQFLLTNSELKKAVCEKANLKETITKWRYQMFGEELENLIHNS
jgi:ribonuclease D